MEHRINKPLPDLDETQDKIVFPLDVAIEQIEVSIDIQHSWRGDLRVRLISPQDTEILLIDRTDSSRKNIVETFRSSDSLSLFAPFIGSSAKGDWRLHIEDTTKNDVGVLRKWGLAIHYAV